MTLKSLLEELKGKEIISEEGDTLSLSLNNGLTPHEIDLYEKRLDVKLPAQFRELLTCSNGLNFFGLQIMPVNEQEFISGQSLISFHNWGNGDFDCIIVDSHLQQQYPSGQIVFRDHQTNLTVPITDSLELWFQKVFDELESCGCLRHPMDYKESKADSILFFWKRFKKKTEAFAAQGLYANARETLNANADKPEQSRKRCTVERELYKDGSVAHEYVYVDGRLHGISRNWHQNGQLRSECHYKNGKLHGPNILWDENGKLIAEGFFKNGKLWEGEFICVDENKNEFTEKYSKGKFVSSTPLKKAKKAGF